MSFFTEFVVATEAVCKAPWSGVKDGKAFFCAFCSHQFAPGDEYRAIFTNDDRGPGGNPLTCRKCFDEKGEYEGLRQEWEKLWQEYKTRFKWWWIKGH